MIKFELTYNEKKTKLKSPTKLGSETKSVESIRVESHTKNLAKQNVVTQAPPNIETAEHVHVYGK